MTAQQYERANHQTKHFGLRRAKELSNTSLHKFSYTIIINAIHLQLPNYIQYIQMIPGIGKGPRTQTLQTGWR